MPWSTSDRKSRLPKDWPKIRNKIFKRDGKRCTEIVNGQRCTSKATDVDHIVNGDDHSPTNLTSKCSDHHAKKSSAEGHTAMKLIRDSGRRQPEKHPGWS